MELTLKRKATDKAGTTSFKAHPSRLVGTVYFRKEMFVKGEDGNPIIPETIIISSPALADPLANPELLAAIEKKAAKVAKPKMTEEEKAAAKADRKAKKEESKAADVLKAKADRAAKAVQKATEKAAQLRAEADKALAERQALAESRAAAAGAEVASEAPAEAAE